jgi:methionine-rich copper-binding protein CopC
MFRPPRLVRATVRAALSLALVAAGLLGSASLALAHAQYQSSNPPSGGTIASLPQTLQVTYTEELASIQFTVTGPDGSSATNGPAAIDLEHRTNASVPLRNAGPGQYTVVWHNVSGDDGDPNDGSFVFTVAGPPAATSTPAPSTSTSTISNSQPSSPQPAPAASNTPASGEDAITPGINDVRINTYRKRQAIRDQYQGKIDVLTFNFAIADGEGLESALKDAMDAVKSQPTTSTHH